MTVWILRVTYRDTDSTHVVSTVYRSMTTLMESAIRIIKESGVEEKDVEIETSYLVE